MPEARRIARSCYEEEVRPINLSLGALVLTCFACHAPAVSPPKRDPTGERRQRPPEPSAATEGPSPDGLGTSQPSAMSTADAWSWVREREPAGLAGFRPLGDVHELRSALLGWATPGMATVVFDRSCRRLELTRNEDSLDGTIHQKTEIRGATKTAHADSIVFNDRITVVCGSDTTYEKTATGWLEATVGATGCFSQLPHWLSQVTETGVWYGDEHVKLSFKCGLITSVNELCRDGSQRACATCTGLAIEVESADHRSVRQTRTMTSRSEQADCSAPCAEDSIPSATLARVNAALAKTEFIEHGHDPHPVLFRSRKACEEYALRHPMAAAERTLW